MKALFPLKGKKEKDFIKKLRSDVEIYCEESNATTKQELYDNYGKPTEVLCNYYSTIDTDYIVRKIKISKTIKAFIAVILILALIATSTYCIIRYEFHQIAARQEAVIMEETIEEF